MRRERRRFAARTCLGAGAVAVLVLSAAPARAIDPSRALSQYVHQQWHAADGLPQETVQALVQSSDGYLWIGTQDGLARYDGSHFALFHRNTPGLGNRDIHALAAGPDGEVWIGTGRGLYVHRRGIITAAGMNPRLAAAIVRCLIRTRDGAVLAGTTAGLFRIRGNIAEPIAAEGGAPLEIVAVDQGPGGEIVALSARAVWRLDASRLVHLVDPPSGGSWRTVRFGADGTLMLGGVPGLWRQAPGGFTRIDLPRDAPGRAVDAIFEDTDRNLWVAGDTGVVRVTAGNPPIVEPMTTGIGQGTSFVDDHDGGLWVGTWGNGLHRLRSGRATIIGAPEGLAGDYALGVFEARDGTMWLGSDGGITRARNGVLKSWGARDGLAGRLGRAFFESPDGTIWVGTERALCRLRGERLDCNLPGVQSANIFAFEDDGAGGFWVATSAGLVRVGADGSVRPGPTLEAGHANGVSWCLLRDRGGRLWVGGERTSLVRVTGDVVERFEPPRIPAAFVLTAFEDADGSIWFGTAGGGLVRYRDGRFDAVSTAHGLPDDVIYAIVPDELGSLWLSSNRGILRVRRDDLAAVADGHAPSLTVDVVGLADGLRSAECNGTVTRAGLRARDGRVWFPTTRGVATIDPREAVHARPVPVVIDEVLADRRSVSLLPASLTVPPGGGELEFRFSVLAFSAGATGLVRYRLDGFDADWRVAAAGERAARYTNLRPGRYVFRVATGSDDEPSGRRIATLPVVLQAHLYESVVVQALAGLLGVALVAGVVVVRVRQLRARQHELQRAVDDAVSHVQVLQGMLPLCAWCRRVRADEGYWQQIEEYVAAHSNAAFTHGICPTCAAELERAERLPSAPGATDAGGAG
jgi:ligand-binding sensor domain-containing protein